MRSAFLKDSFRQVRATFNRFLSILSITALGVAFYAGLKATAPDMRATAQKYLENLNFMDLELISTAGLTAEDVSAVRNVSGVKSVMPACSADALVREGDKSLTVKLLSFDSGGEDGKDDPGAINRPKLVKGRMPRGTGEALADSRFLKISGYRVGDRIRLRSGSGGSMAGTLKSDDYVIVGVAENPLYISYERGSSSIGSGKVDAYLMLPSSDFSLGVYTEMYLTVSNPEGVTRFSSRYDSLIEPVSKALNSMKAARTAARYQELENEGQKKLEDAQTRLDKAEKALSDGQKQLDEAQAEIDSGKIRLANARREFNSQISSAQAKLDASQAQLIRGEASYAGRLKEYQSALSQLENAQTQLDKQKKAAGVPSMSAGQMKDLIGQMKAQAAGLNPEDPKYAALTAQIQGLETLMENQEKLDAQRDQLAGASAGLSSARASLDASAQALAEGKKRLQTSKLSGERQLAEEAAGLDRAEQALSENRAAYEQKKAEAQPGLDQLKNAISEGKQQLSELKKPVWYILNCNMNEGFFSFKQDCDRIDAIANVFPLIFFLVAALVSLTTMTRLVEDDRTYIGTMKALGYGKGVIAAKYLFYAVAASLAGSVIGLVIGYNLFPRVVFNAYRIMYTLPPVLASFNWPYAFLSAGAAVLCAAFPAFMVCIQSLRSVPAQLMRPKMPQPGKRIFLERVTAVWKRMNFSQKVSARNLFRYKKRLLMTVVGVAGCTALVFTGFGLRDSISTIVGKQYEQIRRYDMEVDLKENAAKADVAQLKNTLVSDGGEDIVPVFQQSADLLSGGDVRTIYLAVPENPEELSKAIRLRERVGQKPLRLDDSTVIVTEKIASLCSLKKGGRFRLRGSDGVEKTVTVGGIAENYLFHYVFMSPSLYRKLYGAVPESNQMFLSLRNTSKSSEDRISAGLMKLSPVSSVSFTTGLKENFSKMIVALRYVVLVLIVSAAALAFVVLFSLTSINIDERKRELATIRVLGFRNGEMAAYIYRENIVLTLLGTLLGLFLGYYMERFVISTAEVDLVMFSRDILFKTYLYSAGLTVLFAAFVNAIMFKKIRRIDMVSSLKSME